MRSSSRGFTLVELLAAMMISGLAILGGVLLMDQVTDTTGRITRAAMISARDGNGARLLRQLLLDAHVSADSMDRFRGNERSLDVSTQCQRPRGWLELCRATILVDWRGDSSVIMGNFSTGESLELLRRPGQAEFRYANSTVGDSVWLSRWPLSIAMPFAIAVVTKNDTAVYSTGPGR
jgi:prepilin-type N-terminal cleavage/methylation domain-containing protein